MIVLGGGFYAVLNLYYYALVILRKQKLIFGIYVVLTVLAAILAPKFTVALGIFGAALAYLILMVVMAAGLLEGRGLKYNKKYGRCVMTVDVLIPVYKPDRRFARLLQMLRKQTVVPNRIIIMNTEKSYWNADGYRNIPGMEVHHLTKEEFDHGGTRNLAAWYSESDIMIFMTDDAVPQDEHLIENLLRGLEQKGPEGETVAVAYARQLPAKDCRTIERYTRAFNYPDKPMVKTKKNLETMGIKTYFASNVCCAYRKDIFRKLEGFVNSTLFNEDMIYAATAMDAGYAVAYVPEAKVVHSHNLTPMQQFHRNFDLAVSQAEHPEIFAELKSEGEGIRLVKQTAKYLLAHFRGFLIPELVVSSGCKYLGYKLGKQYEKLPRKMILWCSMSPLYWEKKWRRKS